VYSTHLVRAALQRRALIVVMRAERFWREAVSELSGYPQLFRKNNPQNVIISERNCAAGYRRIVSALTSASSST